jgi:hypothetical protein
VSRIHGPDPVGIYSQCQECMGPLPTGPVDPETGVVTSDDPFCSDECEQIAEEEYLNGYPDPNEGAAMMLIQRYGPAVILPHLAGGR